MARCQKARLEATHELGQRQVKSDSEDLLGPEARLLFPSLQIGNEGPAQPRMDRQICLSPPPLCAELAHPLPES